MPRHIFIPKAPDLISPMLNLAQLRQGQQRIGLQQQQAGALEDYRKQLRTQNTLSVFGSMLAQDPKAAETFFNRNLAQQYGGEIKVSPQEDGTNILIKQDASGRLLRINKATGKSEWLKTPEGFKAKPEDLGAEKPSEVRQWHSDFRKAVEKYVGTLTAMGIVIDETKMRQFNDALGGAEELRKQNMDTNTAVSTIAKEVGLVPEEFEGTAKDRAKELADEILREEGNAGHILTGKPSGRYRIDGREVRWDGTREIQ